MPDSLVEARDPRRRDPDASRCPGQQDLPQWHAGHDRAVSSVSFRCRTVRRHPWALRLRQEHAADDGRRPRTGDHPGESRSTTRRRSRPAHQLSYVMFQDSTLLPWKNALDNVLFPIKILESARSTPCATVRTRCSTASDAWLRRQKPHELSGRHAPARGDLPRAGLRPRRPVDGRAVQRLGCDHPRRDERALVSVVAAIHQDRAVRDAQHPRSGHARRPGCW